jgi:anaerobic selenocysteine-containing dehydrogenase
MCPQGCGLEVTVEQGKPVHVKGSKEHPFNKGWLCSKGRSALDLFHSSNRLKSPLIRKDGRFIQATWEDALGHAAERLQWLKEQYGPQSLALYHGEGVGHQEIKYYMKRFANVYGTPNFMGVGSICNMARSMADTITFGGVTKPDVPNTAFLVIWGGNPFASNEPVRSADIKRLKKRGGKLAVIDPKKTELASKADYHLPVRPGRDQVLALNMLHIIIQEGLWDKPFTDNWVHGFDRLYEAVKGDRFAPEKGEAVTGVPAGLVRQATRAYASAKPASLSMGNGLEHHANGIPTMRLISIMKAITGNLDIRGGDLFTPKPGLKDMTSPLTEPDIPAIGSDRYHLFCSLRKEGRALSLPRAILEGEPYPVKGMIIVGGNPSLEWPDSERVRKALEKLEFLMVVDIVQSPDSRRAHVVLPACTFLERDEHHVDIYHNLHCIMLRRQVVEPLYGIPDQMIWVKLAERMGYGDLFPWKTCLEGIDYMLSDMGVTHHDLILSGGIHEYEERRYKKYEDQGFHTTTRKVEILSEKLREFGYDPFPVKEDPVNSPPESDAFPLTLSTGGNLLPYLHWQYRYIPGLRKMAPEPLFDIHPETASRYGISENDMAEVQTPHGAIRLKPSLSKKVRQDTIHIAEGWEEANANELTSLDHVDPISGFPNLKSLKCLIRKL